MGLEPPPNVMRADALRKGQIRGRVRTGAKTATKDQEREYLERFRALADDPSPLVPAWQGTGRDPLEPIRRRLEKIRSRQSSGFWLWWHGRDKGIPGAYAHTLVVLKGGRIPSFASLRFRGRDVRFVLRGRGLRDALVTVQNHDETDVRLLGYIRYAKAGKFVVISTPDRFEARPANVPIEPELAQEILAAGGFETVVEGTVLMCPHEGRTLLAHDMKELGLEVRWCSDCATRTGVPVPRLLEQAILVPRGTIASTRRLRGDPFTTHPESAKPELATMLERAGEAALEKEKGFTEVSDADLLTWSDEALRKELDARPQGFVLVGGDLWLSDFAEAAQRYGSNDLERRALETAFALRPPRVRSSDASLNRLLADVWSERGRDVLAALAGPGFESADLDPLAKQRPSEAITGLERLLADEARLAGFPRYRGLPSSLRLAHDLFRAHHVGDESRFQRRLSEGVRDDGTKALALALARAFGRSAGIEWQFAPHEKDRALFFDPAAREFAASTPDAYGEALARLAQALDLEAPTPIVT